MSTYPKTKPLIYWQSHSPIATSLKGQASEATRTAIRGIANAQCIDYEAACLELFSCKTEELFWGAASTFIEWLKAQPHFPHPHYAISLCPACQFIQMRDGDDLRCNNGHVFKIHYPANRTAQEAGASL